MTKFRTSSKIAIGFAAIAVAGFYGYRYATYYALGREHFAPLMPGDVNVVGLDTSKGYHIVIENRIAKLILGGGGDFEAPKDDKALEAGGGERKFIPIKDMLAALQGSVAGLSYFVERLNDITDTDLPPDAPLWKMEDIEKALKGDQALKQKLIRDLNTNLDGTPLDTVRTGALFNGVVVDVAVPLQVQLGGDKRIIQARVKRPYKTAFMTRVENAVSDKFATPEVIAKEYAAVAAELKSGQFQKENIPDRLRWFNEGLYEFAKMPQAILNSITPVINENQITGARFETQKNANTLTYTLIINLTDEGVKRLWQFSHNRIGDQLLFTVRGVAISAPRIEHGLSDREVRISGLTDDSLVEDAVATINEKRATTKK
jgi:hypothetical protein